LRSHWGAVLEIAELPRKLGALTPPHGIELAHMALAKPPRPLTPGRETLISLCESVEAAPELRE